MSKSKIGRPLPQLEDPKIYPVNWEKIAAEPGIEVILNMMFCLNDLLSQSYLMLLVDQDELRNKHLVANHRGHTTFLLRNQAGALFAAHEYFIEKLNKQDQLKRFVEEFHEAHADIAALYESFKQLCNDKKFTWIKVMRNSFAYHLNYDKNSALTRQALTERLKEFKERGADLLNLPGMQVSKMPLLTRCILGDSVLVKAMRQVYGDIPDSDHFDDDKTKEAKSYLTALAKSFVDWAEPFLETYLKERELLIDKPVSTRNLFKHAKSGASLLY